MKIDKDYPSAYMQDLFIAVLKLRTPQEASNFFRDLLTIAELKEFANRWQVVTLLNQGMTYEAIAKRLMISTATVTRVAYWLHHGMGGYRLVARRVFLK